MQSSALDVHCIRRYCAIVSTRRLLYQNIFCNRFHLTFAVSEDFVQSSPLDFCFIRRYCLLPTRLLFECITRYAMGGAARLVFDCIRNYDLRTLDMPVSSNRVHDEVYLIQHYVIKFVSYLRKVRGFHRALRFPPPIKLTATI